MEMGSDVADFLNKKRPIMVFFEHSLLFIYFGAQYIQYFFAHTMLRSTQ